MSKISTPYSTNSLTFCIEASISNAIPSPEKEGAHFDMGAALHACILEPTRFSRCVVSSNWKPPRNEYVEAAGRFLATQ